MPGNTIPRVLHQSQFMPIDRQRYPKNWNQIALSVKDAADWRCQHCQRLCLRPGEKPPSLTRSQRTMATLAVHHANYTPEDNQPENLIALCTPCHLALHGRTKRTNVSPGQLSLWGEIEMWSGSVGASSALDHAPDGSI